MSLTIEIKWIRPGRHMGGQYKAVATQPGAYPSSDYVVATAYDYTEEDVRAKLAARLLELDRNE